MAADRGRADRRRSAAARSLHGIGVCGGRVRGRVRVVAPETIDELQPGEILVAKVTDVGYTPAFAYAAAVVTELGGPISHAAIVAREFGVPCVVNARGAADPTPDRRPDRSRRHDGAGHAARACDGARRRELDGCHIVAVMDFAMSAKAQDYHDRLTDFMAEFVFPAEQSYDHYRLEAGPNDHTVPPVVEELKKLARDRGLWNLFLPSESGLTNLEYCAAGRAVRAGAWNWLPRR